MILETNLLEKRSTESVLENSSSGRRLDFPFIYQNILVLEEILFRCASQKSAKSNDPSEKDSLLCLAYEFLDKAREIRETHFDRKSVELQFSLAGNLVSNLPCPPPGPPCTWFKNPDLSTIGEIPISLVNLPILNVDINKDVKVYINAADHTSAKPLTSFRSEIISLQGQKVGILTPSYFSHYTGLVKLELIITSNNTSTGYEYEFFLDSEEN